MIGATFSLGARFAAPPVTAWSLPLAPARAVTPPLKVATNTNELCQLVTNYAPRYLPDRHAIVERKHDGVRGLWINRQLITRGGLPIWCTAHLWPSLARLSAMLDGAFLDMEYVEVGGFGATARRVSKAIHERGPVDGFGHVFIWDAVPEVLWRRGGGGDPLLDRKVRLRAALATLGDDRLRYVDHVAVASEAHLCQLEAVEYARGGEGVVVKDGRGLHHAGRSRLWQRLKRKLSLDLPVIGYSEATVGGELGSIIVDHDGVGVRVHAGFGDRDRATLWHSPAALIGRIAEVEAMEKTDYNSLRQPRFTGWRDDLMGAC